MFERRRIAARSQKTPRRLKPIVDRLDDRTLLSGVTAAYTLQSNWGSGYQAQISLNNTDSSTVPNWKLEFDLSSSITSIWNAQVTQHSGNHYVITGLAWDSSIGGNAALDFGFVASPGGSTPAPANYLLNGAGLGTPTSSPPVMTVTDATANSGSNPGSQAVFQVSLSKASTTPISVHYATADGTAKSGNDYILTSGNVSFAAGQTQQTIVVPILASAQWKVDSSFVVNLSGPSGVTLGRTRVVGTIHNLNAPPSTGSITFTNTSDWGTGFNGKIDIKNTGSAAVNNWSLEFDFAGQINSIWNASISSHVGNHFVIVPASWNSSIAAGATVSVGLAGSPGGGVVAPTNFVLHPPLSGGGGGVTKPPVAVGDTATTFANQPVSVAVLANDTDPNGLAITIASVIQPTNGTVVVNTDKTITYTPKYGYSGVDTWSYTITDSLGGISTANVAVTVLTLPAPPTWTTHAFAPYVDMTLYPTYNLVNAAQTAGIKNFTLAFITADPSNRPAWGGYSSYEVNGGAFDMSIRQQITNLRAIGGDVMVSFGGASNQELAEVITDTTALKNAYETVINAYNLKHIDFDIEGGASANRPVIDRRSQAIALVQKDMAAAGKPLEIWYTLPVLPTGLTADGLYVLQSGLKYGVQIGGVNVMAMDYGESTAPNPKGQMGSYAIQSATSLFNQLRSLYGASPTDAQLWSKVGVTPMIGMNDDTLEVFDQAAAQQVVSWAKAKGIGRIAMWSLNRDQQNPKGAITYVESTSSSLAQRPYEFSKIFEGFVS